jgi:23S rRNA (adenine2030-N6)-methyltransferase
MNYRHAYHAGNFADVFKHVILTRVLVYLMRKEAAFRLIDTHAGNGIYDLSAEAAEKTSEWRNGIGKVAAAEAPSDVHDLLEPYLAIVLPLLNGDPPLYPGSPTLARRLLRPQDRMIFCDAQEDAIAALLADPEFRRDRRIKSIAIDGFTALKAFVPPVERRGLVLIDPPFEAKTEFADLLAALTAAAQKWPTGVYMAWYPIKDRGVVNGFLDALRRALKDAGIGGALRLELQVDTPHPDAALLANGLVILNPPYPLAVEARTVLPYLARTMGTGRYGADVARPLGD